MRCCRAMLDFYDARKQELPTKTRTGLNTAVVLYNLERLRNSQTFATEIDIKSFGRLAAKYSMRGTLGDQARLSLGHGEANLVFSF